MSCPTCHRHVCVLYFGCPFHTDHTSLALLLQWITIMAPWYQRPCELVHQTMLCDTIRRIHRWCSITEKRYRNKGYCSRFDLRPLPYLRTTMNGTCAVLRFSVRRTRQRSRIYTSTSSPSTSVAITSTTKCVTCAGMGFLVTCSTSELNFIGSRSSLCGNEHDHELATVLAPQPQHPVHRAQPYAGTANRNAPSFCRQTSSRAC